MLEIPASIRPRLLGGGWCWGLKGGMELLSKVVTRQQVKESGVAIFGPLSR